MPHIGQSLVREVGQYGWTMYSVLGGANITAIIARMPEWPVKVHVCIVLYRGQFIFSESSHCMPKQANV